LRGVEARRRLAVRLHGGGDMPIKKILCAVDFSAEARQAVATAVRLANERDAELVLLHAWYLPAALGGEYAYPSDIVSQIADDAERSLAAEVAEATRLGAKRVTAALTQGVPWHQIVDAAKSDPTFDLIVTGSRGRTGIGRVLLGSVAELVVRHAPCPVLTVHRQNEPKPFSHVLCPVDFSPSSRAAAELAIELAHAGGGGVTLLHVVEMAFASGEILPIGIYRDLNRRAADLLDAWVRELTANAAIPVIQQTRLGNPTAEVLGALDADRTFDLVVMGSHGRTGLPRLALGSVAEKTVRHAHCPVLVAHRRS
jgi:nucleotide-binding universal stress UspA family protein